MPPPPGEPSPPGEPTPAEPPPPAPAVQAQDSETAGAPSGYARPPRVGGPVVIVRSDNPQARLQTQGGLKWRDVCVAPCNVPVNPAGLYRIGGGTIRPSDAFNMPRPAGKVVVQAQAGSNVKHWVGVGLIIGGVIDGALGGLYYASASDSGELELEHDRPGQGILPDDRRRQHRHRRHLAGHRHPAGGEQHVRRSALNARHGRITACSAAEHAAHASWPNVPGKPLLAMRQPPPDRGRAIGFNHVHCAIGEVPAAACREL